ncbi:Putative ribonuclease H protein At1g65750 [Linum perenne]
MAWEVGIRKVVVHVDSQAGIKLLSSKEELRHQHTSEVMAIRERLKRDWEVTISHIYREGNYVADYLGDIGHGFPLGTHLIDVSDCTLGYFLRRDCMNISEPRVIHC